MNLQLKLPSLPKIKNLDKTYINTSNTFNISDPPIVMGKEILDLRTNLDIMDIFQ